MSKRRTFWQIFKGTTENWLEDQASSISAALAFYCAFSLAPLLIILVSIAGWIVGGEVAYSYVGSQLTLLFGKPSADLILDAMRSAQTTDGTWATLVSVVMLVVGASTVFAALLLWLYYSAQMFLFGAEFTACLGQSRTPQPLVPAPAGARPTVG